MDVNLKKGKSWFAAFGVQSPGAHEIQLHSPFTIIADSAEVKSDSAKKQKKMQKRNIRLIRKRQIRNRMTC